MGRFFGGIFRIHGVFFGGYILFARDWNLHLLDSLIAGAIGWSFKKLDAAWHEWVLMALAVLIDGVLAVSAQCGCCHNFLPYFSNMPFQVCFLWLHFFSSVGLHPVCYMFYSFLTSILHIILHGLLFVFCVLFLFLGITWCICCGDYGIYLVGGLILLFMYHHLFVYPLWSF